MSKRKNIRSRGKIKFSEYFKKLKEGDIVGVKREQGVGANFPKRIQGRTGKIEGKRGSNYLVKLKEFAKEKVFIIHPVHLKRIKQGEEK